MVSFFSVRVSDMVLKSRLSLTRRTGNRGMGMGNGERGTGNL